MQGTFLFWFLLLLSWLSSSIRIKRFFSWPILFAVLLLQVFLAFWVNSGSLGRAVGSVGEPNSLAGEVVFLWPFLLFGREERFLRGKWRWLFLVVVLFLVGVVVFVSGSRSGMIALLIQLVLLGLIRVSRVSMRWAVIVCLVLLALSYSLPFLEQNGLYENRGEVWESAAFAGLRHPFVGEGFGNTEYALHEANLRLGNHLQGYYVDSSHNIFLDWFVESGLSGLFALCGLVLMAGIRFVKEENLLYLLVLFGLLVTLSFNPVSVVLLVSFWWLVGQGWRISV